MTNRPVIDGPVAGGHESDRPAARVPQDTAPSALRLRFPAGVMLRAGTTLAAGDAGELLVIGERGFSVEGADRALRAWAGRLAEGMRWPAPEALTPGQEALLAAFAARDLLVPLPRTDTVDAYTKQRRWLAHTGTDPDAAQERIARHQAVVVGCGGTGAIVATHLCAMGVRRLLLVDHDAVEVTNFNRQFTYRQADLGRPKAEALRDFLLERHPEAGITAARVFVDEDTITGLVPHEPGEWTLFCCADRPVGTLAALLAGFARDRGGSVLFAAAGLDEAAVGPLLRPDDTAAHQAFAQEMEAVGAVARSALADPVMSASVAPVNTVTAAWMAGEWLNGVILERPVRSLNTRFVVDLGNSSTYEERTWR
ncbi:ThiF family adenylyltransferase [Streptomyces coeruleorubidus]|uniref:ThiF family adenylyltransferase n=1 Tax=Streptomyces coeruleorubidus TaxID=116188 RepID=A0ABZ0KIW6_STRC4|nr:ThiF family adenylyltransferase [Streptomyces coeruleorubidus]WOT37716.1 ThiF family adenylyltransferase [Streptomyces coeruleorubidus]